MKYWALCWISLADKWGKRLSPFTLSSSKGASQRRSCFDKLHERLSLQHPYNYKLISTLPCIGQDPFRIPGLEIFWLAGLKRESPSETKMFGHKQLVINLSHTFDAGNALLAIPLLHGGADGTPQDHPSPFGLDVDVPDFHPQNP